MEKLKGIFIFVFVLFTTVFFITLFVLIIFGAGYEKAKGEACTQYGVFNSVNTIYIKSECIYDFKILSNEK
tara:strand:+ start:1870 stop:2082 length:213 start_codon:yes stop_codon:yes gene_type:complete